jgi:hypothetical protein
MYMLVLIITMDVPAGAYYYHECNCWSMLLPSMYLLVLIITMNVHAGAYYYHECTCWSMLSPSMYLLVRIIAMKVPGGACSPVVFYCYGTHFRLHHQKNSCV